MTLTNAGNSIHVIGQLNVTSLVQNSGFTQIVAGSSASVSTLAVNGGNVQVDGTYSGSTITTSGTGTLSGTGTIPVPVTDGGVTEGGDVPNAGVMTISSSQTFTGEFVGRTWRRRRRTDCGDAIFASGCVGDGEFVGLDQCAVD